MFPNIFFREKFKEVDFLTTEVSKKTVHNHWWTYSKYGEDRKEIWKNTYLKDYPEVIHLGRDYQAPAGTTVYAPINGIIMDIWDDTDNDVGWGRRIDILQNYPKRYWIFGHLDRGEELEPHLRVGAEIEEGKWIGRVGPQMFNGNVFEHIHVQCLQYEEVLKTDSRKIDGYGRLSDLEYHFDPNEVLMR